MTRLFLIPNDPSWRFVVWEDMGWDETRTDDIRRVEKEMSKKNYVKRKKMPSARNVRWLRIKELSLQHYTAGAAAHSIDTFWFKL